MAKFKIGQKVYVTNDNLGYSGESGEVSTVKPYLDGQVLYGVMLKEGNSSPKYFYEDEIKASTQSLLENFFLGLAALVWVCFVFKYFSQDRQQITPNAENLIFFQEVLEDNSQNTLSL